MKFGSVCSGIEAASVAWNVLGWEAAWFSEIEKFPCEVLKHHYPDVPNLGDMTTLPDRIMSGEVNAPDLFCGGTPCQAFSVAGLRKSLEDSRGNLSLTFCEIANAIDHIRSNRTEQPAIIFWENVPGVLNTSDNAFGCFLAGLSGENDPLEPAGKRWTNAGYVLGPKRAVAWRVLDAQYFGVAQRRRRVFVVASARKGFDPTKILFEFEGMRRDLTPSREERKNITTHSGIGVEITGPLNARDYKGPGTDGVNEISAAMIPMFYENHPTDSRVKEMEEVCNTVSARWGTGGGNVPFVQAIALAENTIGRQPQNGGNGDGFTEDGPMYTLNATGVHAVAFDTYNHALSDVNQTIKSPAGGVSESIGTVLAPALTTNDPSRSPQASEVTQQIQAVHSVSNAVRRLTPVECERLQGFPDNYTNIKLNCPDGSRYKALGNSWAVPNVRWIGQRIQKYLQGEI
jgi:DNA (cytosine-5)-methyltransferase 1